MSKPPTSVRSIRLPNETWELLVAEAARRSVSVNALAATAVLKEIALWSDEESAAMRAKPGPALKVNRIPPVPSASKFTPHPKPGKK